MGSFYYILKLVIATYRKAVGFVRCSYIWHLAEIFNLL